MTTSAITSEVTALIRASGRRPGELRTRTPAAEPDRGGEAERPGLRRRALRARPTDPGRLLSHPVPGFAVYPGGRPPRALGRAGGPPGRVRRPPVTGSRR